MASNISILPYFPLSLVQKTLLFIVRGIHLYKMMAEPDQKKKKSQALHEAIDTDKMHSQGNFQKCCRTQDYLTVTLESSRAGDPLSLVAQKH